MSLGSLNDAGRVSVTVVEGDQVQQTLVGQIARFVLDLGVDPVAPLPAAWHA